MPETRQEKFFRSSAYERRNRTFLSLAPSRCSCFHAFRALRNTRVATNSRKGPDINFTVPRRRVATRCRDNNLKTISTGAFVKHQRNPRYRAIGRAKRFAVPSSATGTFLPYRRETRNNTRYAIKVSRN